MVPAFILGIALLAGIVLAGNWYVSTDTKTLLKVLKWGLIGTVALVAVFFLMTGRFAWAIATIPALIPWLMRARSIARMAKTFSRMSASYKNAATGETSEVSSRYLRMILDHDSGAMSGEVLAGPYTGRSIGSLGLGELLNLLDQCRRDDEEGARLVEAYLDREHINWRDAAGPSSSSSGAMDRAEALSVLGLGEGATKTDIRDAHHRLIAGLHPDHGGSDYLAAKINQAKDVLLG